MAVAGYKRARHCCFVGDRDHRPANRNLARWRADFTRRPGKLVLAAGDGLGPVHLPYVRALDPKHH